MATFFFIKILLFFISNIVPIVKWLNHIHNNPGRFLDLIVGFDGQSFTVDLADDILPNGNYNHRSYCCTFPFLKLDGFC